MGASHASGDPISPESVRAARAAGTGVVKHTPVTESTALSDMCGGTVVLKAENLQRTGSFKIRGAMNKVATLGDAATSGVVAGSAGNHAQAIAFAARKRGIDIHHVGDLPARSGMGSSSAFTVGLLHALHALQGRLVGKHELMTEAIHATTKIPTTAKPASPRLSLSVPTTRHRPPSSPSLSPIRPRASTPPMNSAIPSPRPPHPLPTSHSSRSRNVPVAAAIR